MARDAEVVQRPRSTDALGTALRGAFALPQPGDEMAALLRQLDRMR
ncbi:hypothetical protein [Sphingomonas sp.]